MNAANTNRLLTAPEAMSALRIGKTKLYELINTGALEVVRFGPRSTRIKAASVEKLATNGIA